MENTILNLQDYIVEVPRLKAWGMGRVRVQEGNLLIVDFHNRREGIVECSQIRVIRKAKSKKGF